MTTAPELDTLIEELTLDAYNNAEELSRWTAVFRRQALSGAGPLGCGSAQAAFRGVIRMRSRR
ncbi:MAG: hypothetical protein QOK49_164 [Baekduia sp.]|jgi:hypothetical protein|nr:hypothetical protein [Baekduia sp.]